MNEDDIPTLGYATGPPNPMKNPVAIALGAGTACLAIVVGGVIYEATRAHVTVTRGNRCVSTPTWQTQPAGGMPTTEPATDPTTQPSAETSIQHTATEQ